MRSPAALPPQLTPQFTSHGGLPDRSGVSTPRRLLTGRDLLAAIAAGELPPPPAATLLHLDLERVADGETVLGFDARPDFGNPDTVHGGLLSAIVDLATATAVWTQRAATARIVTADLHVSFLRPIPLDGARYTCRAEVIHAGRTQANAVAEITDASGTLFVRGTATCRVRPAAGVPARIG